jgi:RNA polymerase sigma-70 factor (ECF subfamily)
MFHDQLQTRLLDADIRFLIRSKANQLTQANGFSRGDREDLEQELTLRLLQRIKAYDPRKASFYCFALVVLDRVALHIIESRSAACRNSAGTVSLHTRVVSPDGATLALSDLVGPEERSNRVGRFTASEHEARELTLDVRSVVERLPAPLRKLARRLITTNRAEISRNTGQSESELRDQFRRLRTAFEDAGLQSYLPAARN